MSRRRSIDEHVEAMAAIPPARRVRCPEHGLTVPCGGCRADHKAGDHRYDPQPDCADCHPAFAPTHDRVTTYTDRSAPR